MAKKKKAPKLDLPTRFSPSARAAAEAFLQKIESLRRRYKPDPVELTERQERLIAQIQKAFAGVTCYGEARVLLAGEAEDEYLSQEVQAVLATMEERDDWSAIPDDLLFACSTSHCYAGPEAYRFLIPRFLIGALHGVVEIYPGLSLGSKLLEHDRKKMSLLNEAQRQCLEDFLNLDALFWESTSRSQFLPWEIDEFNSYPPGEMDRKAYGALLLQRFFDRECV